MEGEGRKGKKVQGIRSIIGRHKIDRGRLRIVKEMEKPKNLHVRPRVIKILPKVTLVVAELGFEFSTFCLQGQCD